MRIIFTVLLSSFVGVSAAQAAQYPTIVGSWYDPQQGIADCQSYWGVHIEPMSYLSGETRCDFDNVRRDGWKVTWTGQCMFSGSEPERMSVVAIETDGTLNMEFGGGGWGPDLKRCPAN